MRFFSIFNTAFLAVLLLSCEIEQVQNSRTSCDPETNNDCSLSETEKIKVDKSFEVSAPQAALQSDELTVSWPAVSEDATYTVIIGSDANCKNEILRLTNITDTKQSVNFSKNGTFYICVEAVTKDGTIIRPPTYGKEINVKSREIVSNGTPSAVADSFNVTEDESKTLDLTGNDTDPDGDSLTITNATTPDKGSVEILSASTVKYTPNSNATGNDSFKYMISDGNTHTAEATVQITINNVQDEPVANNDTANTEAGNAITISVIANDADADPSDTLSISSVTTPSNGSTSIVGSTQIQYTPNGGFDGTDTFSYTIEDSAGNSKTATVTVSVYPTPTAFTWVGSDDNKNWSHGANWQGGAAPGSGDIAKFSALCGNNCEVEIDSNINVAGIDTHSTFSGSITQLSGKTITVGTSDFAIAGGSFIGSDAQIQITGELLLSGGNFTSTSDSLILTGNSYDKTIMSKSSSAEFSANNGTFKMTKTYSGGCGGGAPEYTLDFSTTATFNNVEINTTSGCGSPKVIVASGDELIVSGDLTQTEGRLYGVWKLMGSLNVAATADGGNGYIDFASTSNQTYTVSTGGKTAGFRVSGGQTVSAAVGTTDAIISRIDLQNGVLKAPSGTLEISDSSGDTTIISRAADGSFDPNNGTVKVSRSYSGGCGGGPPDYTITTTPALSVNHLVIDSTSGCGDMRFHVNSGDEFIIKGDLTLTNGQIYSGTWKLEGNLIVGASAYGGRAYIEFVGSAAQTYAYSAGGEAPGIRLNSGQSLSAASGTTDFQAAAIDIVDGTFNSPSGTLQIAGVSTMTSRTQTVFKVDPAATFNPPATLRFESEYSGGCGSGSGQPGIDVSNNFTVQNVEVSLPTNLCGPGELNVLNGSTLVVNGNLNIIDGKIRDNWSITGDTTIGAGSDGGDASLNFSGTTQSFTNSGGVEPTGAYTVESTSTLTLQSNMDATGGITVDGGVLDRNSYSVTGSVSTINGGSAIN